MSPREAAEAEEVATEAAEEREEAIEVEEMETDPIPKEASRRVPDLPEEAEARSEEMTSPLQLRPRPKPKNEDLSQKQSILVSE